MMPSGLVTASSRKRK